MNWTLAVDSWLIGHHRRGTSYSEVAKRSQKEIGISLTKGQVIGRIWRLQNKDDSIKQRYKSPVKKPLTLGCRYIEGEFIDTDSFCGKETMFGRDYCAEHIAIMYVKPRKKNR